MTDTIRLDAFLKDFDEDFANSFSGVRHDSGDPWEGGEKIVQHYENLKIDPSKKILVFSDALDFEKSLSLYKHFYGRIQTRFGIGTFLSNDLGLKPLSIVSKMVLCNGQTVGKLSDSEGKSLCTDDTFKKRLIEVFAL